MRWPWKKRTSPVANRTLSISDPALARLFSPGTMADLSGIVVGERSALGQSAFYRAVMLIAGQLASLDLKTYTAGPEGTRKVVTSVFDEPDGVDEQTSFEWKESLFLHLLLHGKAGALKIRNAAGAVVRLPLVHPLSFRAVRPSLDEHASGNLPVGGLWFDVSLDDGSQVRFDATDFWYVPGPSLGHQEGIGLIEIARQTLGTAIAAEQAAARTFANGAMISGIATPDYDDGTDITDDVPEIRRQVDRAAGGWENAGAIAVVNRRLKFTPWTMTAQQAQFLESRQFQIEEISRFTGVPPHLLMQTEKQTSWGTGVEMQDRALGRSVLGTWSTRVEQRGGRLLPRPRFLEFDFDRLERPSPDMEIRLDLEQVSAGVMTIAEYRAKRGWDPLPDQPAEPAPPDPPAPDPATNEQEVYDAP